MFLQLNLCQIITTFHLVDLLCNMWRHLVDLFPYQKYTEDKYTYEALEKKLIIHPPILFVNKMNKD
jgi:hypothetical protein